MKRMLLPAAALAIGLWSLPGCASFSRTGGVAVNVVNVLPTQASLFETSAALTLRLINETTEPLVFVGSTHRLYLNGSYVGRAVSDRPLTVPQLGTVTQTVTVYLENLALVRKLAEWQNTTLIDYRLESRFHPEGGSFGAFRAVATGELDLRGLRDALATK